MEGLLIVAYPWIPLDGQVDALSLVENRYPSYWKDPLFPNPFHMLSSRFKIRTLKNYITRRYKSNVYDTTRRE